jgi:hypothetical protein
MNKTTKRVFHPILFSLFPILFLFTLNIDSLNYEEVILPIILVPIVCVVIWTILSLILKNKYKAAMIVSIGIILFFSYGHLHNVLTDSEVTQDISRHRYLVIPFVSIFVITIIYFVKTKRLLNNATTITNGISVALVLMTLVNIGSFAFSDPSLDLENESDFIPISNIDVLPDVYFIILDAYAGESVLNSVHGFDNSEFLTQLKNKDFKILDNANTNYVFTVGVTSSVLNMNYINHIGDELGRYNKNVHPLYEMISDNEVMKNFKSLGYEIVVLGSSHKFTTDIAVADTIICQSNDPINSEFNINLIKTSILKPIYSLLFETHRDKILCSLSELPNVHNQFNKPVFVFSHLLIPHSPFIFGPNGEIKSSETIEVTDEWDDDGYIDQVKFANKKMLEFLENIPLNDKEPIIVMMGDHGTGSTDDINSDSKLVERMKILYALRLPSSDIDLPADMTPVNTFRLIFNEYFEGDYEFLPNNNYLSQHSAPYNFTDVTGKLSFKLVD